MVGVFNADGLLIIGQFAASLSDRVHFAQNSFCTLAELLAGRGQGNALAVTQQQRKADLLLQRVELLLDGLLGEKQSLLRSAEAAAFHGL